MNVSNLCVQPPARRLNGNRSTGLNVSRRSGDCKSVSSRQHRKAVTAR
jgi:hypothetical protein